MCIHGCPSTMKSGRQKGGNSVVVCWSREALKAAGHTSDCTASSCVIASSLSRRYLHTCTSGSISRARRRGDSGFSLPDASLRGISSHCAPPRAPPCALPPWPPCAACFASAALARLCRPCERSPSVRCPLCSQPGAISVPDVSRRACLEACVRARRNCSCSISIVSVASSKRCCKSDTSNALAALCCWLLSPNDDPFKPIVPLPLDRFCREAECLSGSGAGCFRGEERGGDVRNRMFSGKGDAPVIKGRHVTRALVGG